MKKKLTLLVGLVLLLIISTVFSSSAYSEYQKRIYFDDYLYEYITEEKTKVIDHVVYAYYEHKKNSKYTSPYDGYDEYYIVKSYFDTYEASQEATKIELLDDIDGIPVLGVSVSAVMTSWDIDFDDLYYPPDAPNVKEIKFPKNLTFLGGAAFSCLPNLDSYEIPETVIAIGDYAFDQVSAIRSITIPESVKSIGYRSFYECTNLKKVNIKGNLEEIGRWAFKNCSNLKKVYLPENTDGIRVRSSAFAYCSSLSYISNTDKINHLGVGAFHNCKSLKSFTISENIRKTDTWEEEPIIGAFHGCTGLEKINILGTSSKFLEYSYILNGIGAEPVVYVKNAKMKKAVENTGYKGKILYNVEKASGLAATQTNNSVKLTWNKSNATGYRVYIYDAKTEKYTKLVNTTKTSYTVTNLKSGKVYKFAVKPHIIDGKEVTWCSSSTKIKTATKAAAPTVQLKAKTGKLGVTIAPVSGATGYQIYYKTGNGDFKKLLTTDKTSFNAKLQKGTYAVKIRSYRTIDGVHIFGKFSTPVNVTVK